MADTRPLVLTDLSIWDGDSLVDADSLRIEAGKIAGVGAAAELIGSADVRALPGVWAMPGLMDAHVHMELDPTNRKPPAFTDPAIAPEMAARAKAMVRAGITTARDLGGGAWLELALRDQIAAGDLPGPRLLCAGQPITTSNGHCHFWGGVADTDAAVLDVLERQIDRGVDLIKVMATGGQMTPGSQPKDAQYEQSTLESIVQGAANHSRHVAAHCHGTSGIRNAVGAGIHTIEHCSWVGDNGWGKDYDPEVAAAMARKGLWVSPTVNAGWKRYLTADNQAPLERVRANFAAMRDAGVRFIASTDAGIPGVFHDKLAQALDVFAQITQWSGEEILRTATSNTADALGIADRTGRLHAGLSADLLLVDGDPRADLSRLQQPCGVWARGIEIK